MARLEDTDRLYLYRNNEVTDDYRMIVDSQARTDISGLDDRVSALETGGIVTDDHINALIDAKISALGSAEGGAY